MIFLCLGNSLTAGYPGHDPNPDGIYTESHGNIESQYEFWLKNLCFEHLKTNFINFNNEIVNNLIFINRGVPGELTSHFFRRFKIDLLRIKPKPDYSIIIGGTNDLGWGIKNDEIFKNIKELHEISRDNGIFSIGGTIPPIRMEQSSKSYNKRNIELNDMLKLFFKENRIPFADLYKGMMDEDGNLKNECAYLDGLHFSVEGYKQMGEIIFKDAVKDIMEKHYF